RQGWTILAPRGPERVSPPDRHDLVRCQEAAHVRLRHPLSVGPPLCLLQGPGEGRCVHGTPSIPSVANSQYSTASGSTQPEWNQRVGPSMYPTLSQLQL